MDQRPMKQHQQYMPNQQRMMMMMQKNKPHKDPRQLRHLMGDTDHFLQIGGMDFDDIGKSNNIQELILSGQLDELIKKSKYFQPENYPNISQDLDDNVF